MLCHIADQPKTREIHLVALSIHLVVGAKTLEPRSLLITESLIEVAVQLATVPDCAEQVKLADRVLSVHRTLTDQFLANRDQYLSGSSCQVAQLLGWDRQTLTHGSGSIECRGNGQDRYSVPDF